MTDGPYRFDMAYARCLAVPEVAMDKRHIWMIHDILCAWPFKNALEIGSFNGASATAFVEAINSGKGLGVSGTATFCDVAVTHSLMAVAQNCQHPTRARITSQPSWALLDSDIPFDFILVDGNHDLDSVSRELSHIVRRKPLCVMAHDTNATDAGYIKCEGAKLLKDTFTEQGWYTLEESNKREGERTERGLFLATTDCQLFLAAGDAFAKWA